MFLPLLHLLFLYVACKFALSLSLLFPLYPFVSSAVVCVHLFRWIHCSLLLPYGVSKLEFSPFLFIFKFFPYQICLSPVFLLSSSVEYILRLLVGHGLNLYPLMVGCSHFSSNFETFLGLVYSLSDIACCPQGLSTYIFFSCIAQTMYFQ